MSVCLDTNESMSPYSRTGHINLVHHEGTPNASETYSELGAQAGDWVASATQGPRGGFQARTTRRRTRPAAQ